MRQRDVFQPEVLRFQDARLAFIDGNFSKASQEFEEIRPAIGRIRSAEFGQLLDVMLGQCYELLGQWDRELALYRGMLQVQPNMIRPMLGEAVALQNLGRFDEAAPVVRSLSLAVNTDATVRPQVLQLMINDQQRHAAADRDWSAVKEFAEQFYADKSRSDLDNTLLKSDLLLVEGRLAEARKLLAAACKKYPKEVRPWTGLARVLLQEPDQADKYVQVLNLAEKELGDVMALRVARLRGLVRQVGDDTPSQLSALEKGLDKFSQSDRTFLMLQLGAAYLRCRDYTDVKRCWKYAIDSDPKDGHSRQTLFELAVDNKDQETMRGIVQELRVSPQFGPQTALYKYCAATEILALLRIRGEDKDHPPSDDEKRRSVTEASKLINEAVTVRPEWNPLWRVRGEIHQYNGDLAAAISDYQRALQYNSGASQAGIAQRLVQLLYATNRFSDANDVLKRAGNIDTSEGMRRLAEDTIFKGGDEEARKRSLAMVKEDVDKDPNNPLNQIWYGNFLERTGDSAGAEAAYHKAVKVGPKMVQTWELLVRRLIMNNKKDEAVEVVREAALAVADKPTTLAKLYERIAENEQAEKFYTVALNTDPDNWGLIRDLVDFYFRTSQADKALPYLDRVIQSSGRPGADSAQHSAEVDASRRLKAQALASNGNYERVMEATKLVELNAKHGVLPIDDVRAIIALLVNRSEPASRKSRRAAAALAATTSAATRGTVGAGPTVRSGRQVAGSPRTDAVGIGWQQQRSEYHASLCANVDSA